MKQAINAHMVTTPLVHWSFLHLSLLWKTGGKRADIVIQPRIPRAAPLSSLLFKKIPNLL